MIHRNQTNRQSLTGQSCRPLVLLVLMLVPLVSAGANDEYAQLLEKHGVQRTRSSIEAYFKSLLPSSEVGWVKPADSAGTMISSGMPSADAR